MWQIPKLNLIAYEIFEIDFVATFLLLRLKYTMGLFISWLLHVITLLSQCESYSFSEAVVQTCSVKKVFLKIWQNSQENTGVRVSFLIK